ncbi:MAG: spermidine synthase [Nostocoides sp.]
MKRTPGGPSIEWDDTGGALISFGGQPQSYVDPGDPTRLEFDYIAHMATAIDALAPPGPVRITHVGGGGLSLARWVAVTRWGSPQIVLEPDAHLTELVRRELPLPRGHRIRVRPVSGESGVVALRPGSADVLVLDAYAQGQVPASLVTPSFLAACAAALAHEGLLLANLADEPGLTWVGRAVATIRQVLPHTALIAANEVLKGRRFGNTVLVAARAPIQVQELARGVARWPFPAGVWDEHDMERRMAGARPFGETDSEPSRPPPDPGRWRLT